MQLPKYVINLENRSDRLEEFTHNFEGLAYKVVTAIDGSILSPSQHFVEANVAACWLSHQKVFMEFLQTENPHCLVFEDDAVPSDEFFSELQTLESSDLSGIDFLQIGFLAQNGRLDDGQLYSVQKSFDMLVTRHMNRWKKYKGNPKDVELSEKLQLKLGDIQPGTHCYLIGRDLAAQLVNFNNPVFLAADLVFMKLQTNSKRLLYRRIVSISAQSNSPSSIRQSNNYREIS